MILIKANITRLLGLKYTKNTILENLNSFNQNQIKNFQ